jgi:hypothetical protein
MKTGFRIFLIMWSLMFAMGCGVWPDDGSDDMDTPVHATNGGFKDCEACPELVVVPAGRFQNANREQVTFDKAFAVGRLKVSNRQWAACARDGACRVIPFGPKLGTRGDAPASNISMLDALRYVRWLNLQTGNSYRLMSGLEWDYVAWLSKRVGATGRVAGRHPADRRGSLQLVPVDQIRDGNLEWIGGCVEATEARSWPRGWPDMSKYDRCASIRAVIRGRVRAIVALGASDATYGGRGVGFRVARSL